VLLVALVAGGVGIALALRGDDEPSDAASSPITSEAPGAQDSASPPTGEAAPAPEPVPDAEPPELPGSDGPCPTGAPSVTITEVVPVNDPARPEWWDVTIRGTVTNEATGVVLITAVEIPVTYGAPSPARTVSAYASPDTPVLGPGQSTTFDTMDGGRSRVQPTVGEPGLKWGWEDWGLHTTCPKN